MRSTRSSRTPPPRPSRRRTARAQSRRVSARPAHPVLRGDGEVKSALCAAARDSAARISPTVNGWWIREARRAGHAQAEVPSGARSSAGPRSRDGVHLPTRARRASARGREAGHPHCASAPAPAPPALPRRDPRGASRSRDAAAETGSRNGPAGRRAVRGLGAAVPQHEIEVAVQPAMLKAVVEQQDPRPCDAASAAHCCAVHTHDDRNGRAESAREQHRSRRRRGLRRVGRDPRRAGRRRRPRGSRATVDAGACARGRAAPPRAIAPPASCLRTARRERADRHHRPLDATRRPERESHAREAARAPRP